MSKLILAIEDDLAIAELYEEVLIEAGYRVRLMAEKPYDVQSITQLQPDMIIRDWGLNQDIINWDFINAMLDTPSTAAIPILVCTAISIKGNNLGERLNQRRIAVLEKPFDVDELVRLVDQTIGLSV